MAVAERLLQRLRSRGAAAAEREAEHRSIFVYANFRYLKAALLLCALSILAYALHDPHFPPSGNTWLGYTLGTIGALLIVWLAWLGVRKRNFRAGTGRVKGWVSAHVYLGPVSYTHLTLPTIYSV